MSSYFVQYIAFIDERKRPENFPRVVHIQETYSEIENTDHLKQVVNTRVTQLATGPGLVVFKDPDEIIDGTGITFDKRRFIPWHMITHLEMAVALLAEPDKVAIDPMLPVSAGPTRKSAPEGYKN